MTNRVTRFAPSPTGTLHLGNIRTFLINWALARQNGWRILMRIEDLDRSRVRPGATEATFDVLKWLGIDFDDGPFFQSHDLDPYRSAMRTLTDRKLAYSCPLTRQQILNAASAPHGNEGSLRLPPELRSKNPEDYCYADEHTNYRFVVDDGSSTASNPSASTVVIDDQFVGPSFHDPFQEVGDFIIWTKLGVPAYQLAVVVDDARQGVTDVVRGDDLLPSAARQALLYRALNRPEPNWWHLPLVVGEDGHRLAKRHGETHMQTYQSAGVPPQRVLGLLARWCGLCDDRCEMSSADFLQRFRIDTLSHEPVCFMKEDHEWLLQGRCNR